MLESFHSHGCEWGRTKFCMTFDVIHLGNSFVCVCVCSRLWTQHNNPFALYIHIHISAHAPRSVDSFGEFRFSSQQMRARVFVWFIIQRRWKQRRKQNECDSSKEKLFFCLTSAIGNAMQKSSCLILFCIRGEWAVKALREVRATMTNLLGRMSLAQPNCFRVSP